MRMFLIGMCDIFLILYLTGLTNIQAPTALTIEDFYALQAMHEELKADKDEAEKLMEERLRQEREEKEKLLAKLKEQEELDSLQKNDLLQEKERLEAMLALRNEKVEDLQKSLTVSKTNLEKINQDLKEKERMLKAREQLLVGLNKEISEKEKARQQLESSYQEKLKDQTDVIAENQQRIQELKVEAQNAGQLADQMKVEAAQAYKAAEVATDVQKKALILKEEALKDKAAAEKKAAEALAARQAAEAEKLKALEAMETATAQKEEAQAKAKQLTVKIQDITQDGDTAYTKNIVPQVQKLKATYERKTFNETDYYKRELTLLPITIDQHTYVIFPSWQIGFAKRSDSPPDNLIITYEGTRIEHWLINKDEDLIAIELPDYAGKAQIPYPQDMPIEQFMPTLLAVRNNGIVNFSDAIRGISEEYFIVNRDYLKIDKNNRLRYHVRGFRGTGTRGERIVLGDQLIDLNGRLIGIANDADRILRINSLVGWTGN